MFIMKLLNIVYLIYMNFMNTYLYFIDNRLLDSNSSLQIQCNKLGNDVHHLRLANAGLEKASEARLI